MPDLLIFEKVEIVANDKAKIREARTRIIKSLIHDAHAESFVKSKAIDGGVRVSCEIAVVDLAHWTKVVNSAHSDRKSLEPLLIGFDQICSKLNIDATGFDNFGDLVDQVLNKIEK